MKKAFAVSAKSKIILKRSSSGGIFYVLAKYYIKKLNGVVYGATIEDSDVFHLRVTESNKISKLLKSKYVKSDLRNTFFECKSDLDKGNEVLFVGLPCQIVALYNYLNNQNVDTKKLLTIDLICHGAPNRKTFEEYLHANFKDEIIKSIDFRYKKPFWENYSIKIITSKRRYIKHKYSDNYVSAFLKGYNLDESCYRCAFKGNNRKSSMTIGDFWGVKTSYPRFYNNRGTSLLIVNDLEKFNNLIDIFRKQTTFNEVSLETAIKDNKSYLYPTVKPQINDTIIDSSSTERFKKIKLETIVTYLAKRFCKRK